MMNMIMRQIKKPGKQEKKYLKKWIQLKQMENGK